MERDMHYIYPDVDTLAAAFVCEFSKFLLSSSGYNRPLHVALSGGSTPLAIFRQLAGTTHKEDWGDIHLYWGDERCVRPDDPQSNFGQARNLLIDPLGIPEDQVHRILGEEDPSKEVGRYSKLLNDQLPVKNGIPVFDWIWLGLGEDGHTVSIFPDQIHLWNGEDPCVIATHPKSGQKRISLSGRVINAASRVTFLVAGKNKEAVVKKILMKDPAVKDLPASYVSPHSAYLEWYMDQEAASGL